MHTCADMQPSIVSKQRQPPKLPVKSLPSQTGVPQPGPDAGRKKSPLPSFKPQPAESDQQENYEGNEQVEQLGDCIAQNTPSHPSSVNPYIIQCRPSYPQCPLILSNHLAQLAVWCVILQQYLGQFCHCFAIESFHIKSLINWTLFQNQFNFPYFVSKDPGGCLIYKLIELNRF